MLWEFAHKWQRYLTAYMLQRNAPDITPRRLLCHAVRIVIVLQNINKRYRREAPPLSKEGFGEECKYSSNRRFTTAAYTPETNSVKLLTQTDRTIDVAGICSPHRFYIQTSWTILLHNRIFAIFIIPLLARNKCYTTQKKHERNNDKTVCYGR